MAVTAGDHVAQGATDEAREGDNEDEFHLGSKPHFAAALLRQLDVGEGPGGHQVHVALVVFQAEHTLVTPRHLGGNSFFQLVGGAIALKNDFPGRVSDTNMYFHAPSVRQSAVGFSLEG